MWRWQCANKMQRERVEVKELVDLLSPKWDLILQEKWEYHYYYRNENRIPLGGRFHHPCWIWGLLANLSKPSRILFEERNWDEREVELLNGNLTTSAAYSIGSPPLKLFSSKRQLNFLVAHKDSTEMTRGDSPIENSYMSVIKGTVL